MVHSYGYMWTEGSFRPLYLRGWPLKASENIRLQNPLEPDMENLR